MTQAFNLSQLANNLDSSGRLDATDGLVNAVPVANGGTGASSASAARTNLGVSIGTDVPSPTGTGASGTWAIDISGNASTVTTITTSQVLSATASASAGGVGTYAMGRVNLGAGTYAFGSTFSGSSIFPASLVYDSTFGSYTISASGSSLSGTWRFMSYAFSGGSAQALALFLRIS